MDALDTRGIYFDQSGDEHLETEMVNSPSSKSLAPQEIDTTNQLVANTPNQSHVEDILDLVTECLRKKLLQRLARGIPKPTHKPEFSSKVKYPTIIYLIITC